MFTHYCRIRKLPIQNGWQTIDVPQFGKYDILTKKRLHKSELIREVYSVISGRQVLRTGYCGHLHVACIPTVKEVTLNEICMLNYKINYKDKFVGFRGRTILMGDAKNLRRQKGSELPLGKEIVAFAQEGNVFVVINWTHNEPHNGNADAHGVAWFFDLDSLKSCFEGSYENPIMAKVDICAKHFERLA